MSQYAIEIENLVVAYQYEPVLWDINFNIEKGRMVAIVGPNGAGKSTLIQSVLGIKKAIAGSVRINGFSLSKNKKQRNTQIAYVPQKSSVDWDFPITVFDVVLMGRYGHLGWFKRPKKEDKAIAKQMLKKVEMNQFFDRQIGELSGGQKQRVFLARALAQQADIYILDEPLAGVDSKSEVVIMKLLRELVKSKKTVIVVHHDLQTVKKYFDEVILLNRTVIGMGPVARVFTESNIEKTYQNIEWKKNRGISDD